MTLRRILPGFIAALAFYGTLAFVVSAHPEPATPRLPVQQISYSPTPVGLWIPCMDADRITEREWRV